jgi:hypothetical protein
MVDRVSASITIGGAITAADYTALALIIADEGLSIEWDGEAFLPEHRTPGHPLYLYAHEVSWGRFASLEAWCIGKGLPFARWSGACPGQRDAERLVFTGQGKPLSYPANENNQIVANLATVECLGSMEAIIAWFDKADAEIPPLTIDGEVR